MKSHASGPCADLDKDGSVNVSDLLLLLAAYATSTDGDVDRDGVTGVTDLLALLAAYGSETDCGSRSSTLIGG